MKDLSNYKLINVNFNREAHSFFIDNNLTKTQIKKIINECIGEVNKNVGVGQEADEWELIEQLEKKGFIDYRDFLEYRFNIKDRDLISSEKVIYRKLK